jgi:hypothetical protein
MSHSESQYLYPDTYHIDIRFEVSHHATTRVIFHILGEKRIYWPKQVTTCLIFSQYTINANLPGIERKQA